MRRILSLITLVALFSSYVVEGTRRKGKKGCGKGRGMKQRIQAKSQMLGRFGPTGAGSAGCGACVNGGNFQQGVTTQGAFTQQL
jgi:hypothetical protein